MTQNHIARLLKQTILSSVPAFPVMEKFCVLCSTEFQKAQRGYKRISLNSSTDDTGTSVLSVLEEAGVEIDSTNGFLCHQCLSPLKKLKKAQDELDTISKQSGKNTLKRKSATPFTPPQQKSYKVSSPRVSGGTTKVQTKSTLKEQAAACILQSKYKTAFRTLMRNRNARTALKTVVNALVKKEIKQMKGGPLAENVSIPTLNDFKWIQVFEDMKTKCPILYSILTASICKRKTLQDKEMPGLGTVIGILLHLRHPTRFKYLQSLTSIIMWLSGANLSLFQCFNNMGICTSAITARRKMDVVTENFDAKIAEWRQSVENDARVQRYRPAVRSLFPDPSSTRKEHPGFSICWDNVQYLSERRHHTSDKTNKMHMWAMTYAAANRIGFHHLRSKEEIKAVNIPMEALLPTDEDNQRLISRMAVIISRIIVDYIPHFAENYQHLAIRHISHTYEEESKKKSEIVNLGVISEDPSTIAGVIRILSKLQKYVPKDVSGKYMKVICHGDGLSVERHRDAQRARAASNNEEGKLQGLVPTPQEFHKRALLLQDTMTSLAKAGMTSRGTLLHIRNLFNHKNVKPTDVMQSFNHCVDFMQFTTSGMVCLMTMRILGMADIGDEPQDSPKDGPDEYKAEYLQNLCNAVLQEILPQLPTADEVVDSADFGENYPFCNCNEAKDEEMIRCSNHHSEKGKWFHQSCVDMEDVEDEEDWYCSGGCSDTMNSNFCCCKRTIPGSRMIQCGNKVCPFGQWFHLGCKKLKDPLPQDWYCSHPCVQKLPITNNEGEDDDIDHIFEYSKAVIYRGLYDLVHRDVLRENDGQAMVSLWKNHMVDFNNNGHNKYLINGHMLLTGIAGFHNERIRNEMIWNRTVNLNGGAGKNIAMDLANEFLNRDFKENIKQSRGNYTDADIKRRSVMVGTMGKNMHKAYEKNLAKTFVYHSAGHTTDPYQADVQRFVEEYKVDKLCHIRPGRHHIGYEDFNFRITAENPTNLVQRLHKYAKKMDLRKRIQNML